MSNILYLEDDPILGESLKLNMELENYKVTWVRSLKEANNLNNYETFDIAILDLALPDGSGLNFCKKLRSENINFPIFMLTAQLDEEVVVESLNSGANDYIKKPFSTKELFARIRVSLKNPTNKSDKISFRDLSLMPEQRKVIYKGKELSFNRREFDLLRILTEKAGVVITREQMITMAGLPEDVIDRTVDSHISHIRSKFKKENIMQIQIKSEYGLGYRMVPVED